MKGIVRYVQSNTVRVSGAVLAVVNLAAALTPWDPTSDQLGYINLALGAVLALFLPLTTSPVYGRAKK